MKLHIETSLARAIIEIALKISQNIGKFYSGSPVPGINAYIFGGAAVHLYTGRRMTTNLDIEFCPILNINEEINADFFDEKSERFSLSLSKNGVQNLCILHDDYQENAIPIPIPIPIPNRINIKMKLFALSPMDLAISKIARFSELDRSDIAELSKRKLLNEKRMISMANSGLKNWVGENILIKYNLKDAAKIIHHFDADAPPDYPVI